MANVPHAQAVAIVTEWLIEEFGFGRVRPESHIEVGGSGAAVADVVVHDGLSREFWGVYPKGAEVSLLVDVGCEARAELFATAEVQEYWLVDPAEEWILVHRKPVDGRYTDVSKTKSASPEVRPQARLTIAEVFPA